MRGPFYLVVGQRDHLGHPLPGLRVALLQEVLQLPPFLLENGDYFGSAGLDHSREAHIFLVVERVVDPAATGGVALEGQPDAILVEFGKGPPVEGQAGDQSLQGVVLIADGAVGGLEGCVGEGVHRK